MNPLTVLPPITTDQAREIADRLRDRLGPEPTPDEIYNELMREGDSPQRLLSFKNLRAKKGVPFSRQYLGRLEAQGRFPARVRLGPNSVAWLESEVDFWIEMLPRGRIVDGRVERGREALARRRATKGRPSK